MEKTNYNKKKFMIWFKEGKKEKRHDYEAQDEAVASKIIAKITFLQVLQLNYFIYVKINYLGFA